MAEPVRRMERAFFERLALVRSGGDSIRRSMAASSFYAAVEAVRAKKNGGLDFSKPPLGYCIMSGRMDDQPPKQRFFYYPVFRSISLYRAII